MRLGKLGALVAVLLAICFCVFMGAQVLIAWAGQTTVASFTLDLPWRALAPFLGVLFGLAGFAYGWRQAELRRKSVRHLAPRVQLLEETIDPDRSSSGLDPSGQTPDEEG